MYKKITQFKQDKNGYNTAVHGMHPPSTSLKVSDVTDMRVAYPFCGTTGTPVLDFW